jgi:hypothetical protein
MNNVDDLISETQSLLGRPFRRPGQASAAAMNLFLLSQVHHLGGDPRVVELQERFAEALGDLSPEDVLTTQIRYASGLASAPGALLYEEMHKLFSLADEIYALRGLGYVADRELLSQLEIDLRARFADQPRPAHLVAEDKVEDWNHQLWWYAENLSANTA